MTEVNQVLREIRDTAVTLGDRRAFNAARRVAMVDAQNKTTERGGGIDWIKAYRLWNKMERAGVEALQWAKRKDEASLEALLARLRSFSKEDAKAYADALDSREAVSDMIEIARRSGSGSGGRCSTRSAALRMCNPAAAPPRSTRRHPRPGKRTSEKACASL